MNFTTGKRYDLDALRELPPAGRGLSLDLTIAHDALAAMQRVQAAYTHVTGVTSEESDR